jgi:NifU-like protein involved in Fe-S cluster formation
LAKTHFAPILSETQGEDMSELISLYSARILQLTTQIPHLGRLDAPTGSATKRSQTCGSSVTVDVVMAAGRIQSFAQEVKACALGQAAAAVLGGAVLGRTPAEVMLARDQLAAMLALGGPAPDAPFDDYHVLIAAKDYKNRHPSILLALEATLAAMA